MRYLIAILAAFALPVTSAGANAPTSLVEFTTEGAAWKATDLSDDTDQLVASGSAVVNTRDVMHVYSIDEQGSLIETNNNTDDKPGPDWSSYDLSAETGTEARFVGRPAAIETQGVAMTYVTTKDGRLLEFVRDYRSEPLWKVYDLTAAMDLPPMWNPTAIIRNDRPQVYMTDNQGNLWEFLQDYRNGRLWNGYNLTQLGGGPPVKDPSVVMVDGVPRIYATALRNGNLIETAWPQGSPNWRSYDLTAATGGPPLEKPAALVIDNVPRVFATVAKGRADTGNLIETVWQNGSWKRYDLTAWSKGPRVAEVTAVAYNGLPRVYGVQRDNNNLIEATPDNSGGRLWNSYDLTARASGPRVLGPPAAAVDSAGRSHVYARAALPVGPGLQVAPRQAQIGPRAKKPKTTIESNRATIRQALRGLVIANGLKGDRMQVVCRSSNNAWVFGKVKRGRYSYWGWVLAGNLNNARVKDYKTCDRRTVKRKDAFVNTPSRSVTYRTSAKKWTKTASGTSAYLMLNDDGAYRCSLYLNQSDSAKPFYRDEVAGATRRTIAGATNDDKARGYRKITYRYVTRRGSGIGDAALISVRSRYKKKSGARRGVWLFVNRDCLKTWEEAQAEAKDRLAAPNDADDAVQKTLYFTEIRVCEVDVNRAAALLTEKTRRALRKGRKNPERSVGVKGCALPRKDGSSEPVGRGKDGKLAPHHERYGWRFIN